MLTIHYPQLQALLSSICIITSFHLRVTLQASPFSELHIDM